MTSNIGFIAVNIGDIEGHIETYSNDQIQYHYIDGLVQDYSNSIANALELLQSCTISMV